MTFEDEAGKEAFGGADELPWCRRPARGVPAGFDEYSAHSELIGGSLIVQGPGAAD